MRILQLTPRFWPGVGGVETQVYQLSNKLIEKGHEVLVFTSDLIKFSPITRYNKVKDNVNGIDVYYFKAHKLISTADSSVVFPSMISKAMRVNVDIIHCHSYGYFSSYAGAMISLLRKTPCVFSPHFHPEVKDIGLPVFLKQLFDPTIGALTFKLSNVIFAFNDRVADYINRMFHIDYSKIRVIPNAVDLSPIKHKYQLPTSFPQLKRRRLDDSPIILYIGRIEKRKGLDVLIDATYKIVKVMPSVKLLIVGDDWGYKSVIINKIKRLGIANNVVFTGPIPWPQVLEAYALSDVLVLPSKSESFGLCLLEAASLGKPVVATDVGGISQIVSDGVNGFLVDYNDVEGMAEAIMKILIDHRLALKLGENGRDMVKEKYSWDVILPKIIEIYDELI